MNLWTILLIPLPLGVALWLIAALGALCGLSGKLIDAIYEKYPRFGWM